MTSISSSNSVRGFADASVRSFTFSRSSLFTGTDLGDSTADSFSALFIFLLFLVVIGDEFFPKIACFILFILSKNWFWLGKKDFFGLVDNLPVDLVQSETQVFDSINF